MSLRAKLACVLAALAALATIAVGWLSYDATRDRLLAEIDRSLEAANRPARGGPGPSPGQPEDGGAELPVDDRPFGVGQFVAQLLNREGERVAGSTEVELPISDEDLEIARNGEGEAFRTATASDGIEYRIMTRGGRAGAFQIGRDLTEVNNVLSDLRTQMLAIGGFVVALAAGAGWFAAQRLTKPLRALTAAATEVSSTGRLDIDVPGGGNDEVGQLGTAFSSMLAALARSRDDQQRLVQDAGHELRTPLTSLRTNVDVLRRYSDLPPDMRSKLLDDLDSEVAELSALVEEVVEVGAGRNSDEPAAHVRLAEVVSAATERVARRTARVVTIDADDAVVLAQRALLERAVTNLLDNAAKFDSTDIPIEVVAKQGRVAVRDHGPGIEPSDLPKVFDRFYRATAARSQPGSGLGLAIVAEVVAAHSGSTFAENHPGGGAVVGFQLPIQLPRASSDNGTAVAP